jgi:hypothetical protein
VIQKEVKARVMLKVCAPLVVEMPAAFRRQNMEKKIKGTLFNLVCTSCSYDI